MDGSGLDPDTLDMINKITRCTAKTRTNHEVLNAEQMNDHQLDQLENQLQEMDQVFQWATKMKYASEQVWIKWKQID